MKVTAEVDGVVNSGSDVQERDPTTTPPRSGTTSAARPASAGDSDPCPAGSYVPGHASLTGCGRPPPVDQTLEGKSAQRKFVNTAAAGYILYGNQIGLLPALWPVKALTTTGLCGQLWR